MKILVIEDDSNTVILYKALFETFKDYLDNPQLVFVGNLHDALVAQIARDTQYLFPDFVPFDFVVLDLKLPIQSRPDQYHEVEHVIEVISEKFEGTAVVILSNFIDKYIKELAEQHQFTYIDKSKLKVTKDFLEQLLIQAEVSKRMRLSNLLAHATTGALTVAFEPTANLQAYKDPDDIRAITFAERDQSRSHLLATFFVGTITLAVLAYDMMMPIYHLPELPNHAYILAVCAVLLSTIFGIGPWVLRFFLHGASGLIFPDVERDKED